jgi:hypothetical protein
MYLLCRAHLIVGFFPTIHYFKTDPGDGDQIVATVLFETYVPKREYDDVHGDLDYRLATGAQAPNLGDNVYNAVGWNHYNGNTVPYPAWTQGFYQKTVSYSQVRDQYILFTFTGKRVIVYGELSDNKGIAGFTIGNGPEILRDLYANTKVNNNQVIFTQDVTEGSHILKIRVTGNKNPSAVSGFVMIDKIVVE